MRSNRVKHQAESSAVSTEVISYWIPLKIFYSHVRHDFGLKWSHSTCYITHCLVRAVWTLLLLLVGFSRPSLLRSSRRVQCGWDLHICKLAPILPFPHHNYCPLWHISLKTAFFAKILGVWVEFPDTRGSSGLTHRAHWISDRNCNQGGFTRANLLP